MKYEEMRLEAQDGDIVATSAYHFSLIQFATKERYKHVGILVWLEDGLFVAEFTFPGYHIIPASQWMQDHAKDKITYGVAPKVVRLAEGVVRQEVLRVRDAPRKDRVYAWWQLPVVLLSQWFYFRAKVAQVCSAFGQMVWEACGFIMPKCADPGDVVRYCPTTYVIE